LKWTNNNMTRIQTMLNVKYIRSILPSIVGSLVDEDSTRPIPPIDNKDWMDWAEKNGITTSIPEDIEEYMTVRNGAGPCKSDLFVPNDMAERALILGYLP